MCSSRVIGDNVICSRSAGKGVGVVRQVPIIVIIVRPTGKAHGEALGCFSYSIMLYIFLGQFLKEKKIKFTIKMLVCWTLELCLNVVSSGSGHGPACTIQAEGHSAVASALASPDPMRCTMVVPKDKRNGRLSQPPTIAHLLQLRNH